MQRLTMMRWLAPATLALFAVGPAAAQSANDPVNPARKLEAEIEAYPLATDSVVGDAVPNESTRIPEEIHPPKKAPTGPAAAQPEALRLAEPQLGSDVAASEVQRVFGRDVSVLDLHGLTPAQVTRLQQRLHELGLYRGKIDGIAGPQTRAALHAEVKRQFQLSRRLLDQGQITTRFGSWLGVTPDTAATQSSASGIEPRPAPPPRGAMPAQPREPSSPQWP